MKTDKIIWGIILFFVGSVLLLDNFNLINFHWMRVWKFWPVVLIITGLNMLFNKNGKQTGSYISLAVLVIALVAFFFLGQQPPLKRQSATLKVDMENDHYETVLSEPLGTDSIKPIQLNIKGGGASYKLKGETDSLFLAKIEHTKKATYALVRHETDSLTILNFHLGKGRNNFHLTDAGHDVRFFLNKEIEHQINLNIGAGEAKFDLSDFKLKSLTFNGGAAELDLKIGNKLPTTYIEVNTGVADIKIKVPKASACQIRTKTGLSTKDFEGFNKISENLYQSPNFTTTANKVFIDLDGGLSNFEVQRY